MVDQCSRIAFTALVALLLTACGPEAGTAVGNGRTISFELQGYEDTSSTATQSITLSSGTRLDTVYMVVERLRLVPGTDCGAEEDDNDDESDIDGPFVANLLEGGVLDGAPGFTTESESFCRFRLKFKELDIAEAPAETPAELADQSIRITGTRSDGIAFTVESAVSDTFKLDATGGSFKLQPGEHPFIVGYELSAWVSALALDTLNSDPIVINSRQNSDRLDVFEDAVKASARLFRDQNGDGELSATEHDSGSALAGATTP